MGRLCVCFRVAFSVGMFLYFVCAFFLSFFFFWSKWEKKEKEKEKFKGQTSECPKCPSGSYSICDKEAPLPSDE